MNRILRLLATTSASVLTLVLVTLPAAATEAVDGREKITLPKTWHDRVGLILIGLLVLAAALGLANARRQLKGKRGQATGEWRWR